MLRWESGGSHEPYTHLFVIVVNAVPYGRVSVGHVGQVPLRVQRPVPLVLEPAHRAAHNQPQGEQDHPEHRSQYRLDLRTDHYGHTLTLSVPTRLMYNNTTTARRETSSSSQFTKNIVLSCFLSLIIDYFYCFRPLVNLASWELSNIIQALLPGRL